MFKDILKKVKTQKKTKEKVLKKETRPKKAKEEKKEKEKQTEKPAREKKEEKVKKEEKMGEIEPIPVIEKEKKKIEEDKEKKDKKIREVIEVTEEIEKNEEEIPLIKFEGDASAPILRYDVPSPSSYTGKVYIETDIGKEYFGGEKITDKNQEDLFKIIKSRFLRENRDIIKEYLSEIPRKELEDELEYFTLKEEEDINMMLLEQAKTEAAKKAADTARVRADQARKNAVAAQKRADNLNKIAEQHNKKVAEAQANLAKQPPTITLFGIKVPNAMHLVAQGVLANAIKLAEGPRAKAQRATNAAMNAASLAEKAEQEAIAAAERLSAGTEEEDILNILNLEEMGAIQAKYILFKYLMDIAWNADRRFPVFYETMGGTVKIRFVKTRDIEPRMLFIETQKLTNFPGDYGAGTTIKTFSLLPGEVTEISIKTFKKSKEEMKEASSILDSYTQEKADEFEKGVQQENARSSKEENSSSFNISAKAGVSFGFGSASVSTGYESSSNSSREETSKNVMSATAKHAQQASAKREINVNTSFEKSVELGEETSIMRKIENMNTSRTLNFTFRQMNQQFHSILHLTDLRIGFYNGYPGSFRAYTLPELSRYVFKYMNIPDKTHVEIFETVKSQILKEYTSVMDHQGSPYPLIEEVSNGNGGSYLRVIPLREVNGEIFGKQEYIMRDAKKDESGNIIQPKDTRYLEGVILSNKVITMRTDGIIVESLLGKANALDKYSLDARKEKIREKKFENDQIKLAIDLIKVMKDEKNYKDALNAYKEIFGIKEGIEIAKELFSGRKTETLI